MVEAVLGFVVGVWYMAIGVVWILSIERRVKLSVPSAETAGAVVFWPVVAPLSELVIYRHRP